MDGAFRIIFAGGGTGGHLHPAVAIWEELRRLAEQERTPLDALALCSRKPLDGRTLTAAGLPHTPLPASAFSLAPRRLARFLAGWGPSVQLARQAIRDARNAGAAPVVVAMGGYVAAPAARAARAERAPLAMVNLDAVAGRANRMIARLADLQLIVGEARLPARAGAAQRRIGPIVRRSVLEPVEPRQARQRLGLLPDVPTLLVTGGSQGASSINRFLEAFAASSEGALLRGWQVLHQAGAGPWRSRLEAAYAKAGAQRAVVVESIDTMGLAWRAASLAVSRAGAGAVAEVWATATPCLFLPYPHHRDQHQAKNAAPLVAAGGAVVAQDRIDPQATLAGQAGAALRDLLRDAQALQTMRRSLATLPPASGAREAATALLELVHEAPERLRQS